MNISVFTKTIDNIIQWGIVPKLPIDNKEFQLKKSLILLYHEYLTLDDVVDDNQEYPVPPEFNFEKISNTIRSNFPILVFYQIVVNPFDLVKPDNGLADANDDLSDVIKDLMEVQWRFNNTSNEDAIWYFEFIMRNSAEQHIVNLLKFLKDKEDSVL